MEHLVPQEYRASRVNEEKEVILDAMERLVNQDKQATLVSLEKKVLLALQVYLDPQEVKEIQDLLEKQDCLDLKVLLEYLVSLVWRVHLDCRVIQDHLVGWETKEPQEGMAKMELMEIQDHQDLLVTEANLVKMEYLVQLDLWEKKVHQEVMVHQGSLVTKVQEENKGTLDCQDLKEGEVGQDLLDQ